MQAQQTKPAPSHGRTRRAVAWLRPAVTAGMAVVLMATTGCFRPSADTQALREGLLKAGGKGWDAQIELGVGALTFGLARSGAAFLDLPPEAKTVLRSVRGADVGIYRYYGVERPVQGAKFLRAADLTLEERGYERMVGVLNGHETVAVYVPRQIASTRSLRMCVVVANESEMVIVSARGNPEPLITMALERARREIDLASVN